MLKKIFLTAIVAIAGISLMAQNIITGRITDNTDGTAIEGVHVIVNPGKTSTVTNTQGYYTISGLPSGDYTVTFSHVAYESAERAFGIAKGQKDYKGTFNVGMTMKSYLYDEIIIAATRADNKTPLTTSTMSREELDDNKIAPSLPYQIELEPSVVASGENGMVGATSFRIRGVDATRINVNINGITLNDPESQAVFWYNIPNLGGMSQSLQLQRGIGASTGGSASFGGSLNLQTLNPNEKPYAEADLAYGSFNTRQYGITVGTGMIKNKFSFDLSYNGLQSNGFIRNGKADQQSLFFSGGYYGKKWLLKGVFILGHQKTGITWDGAYASDLDVDPRYNGAGAYKDEFGNVFYYDNETDNYNQRHYQLYFSYMPNDSWTLNAAFDFTHGDGYYEQYKDNKKPSKYGLISLTSTKKSDFIHQKKMFNSAYTGSLSAKYTGKIFSISFGDSFLYYDGKHFGNLIWAQDIVSLNGNDTLNVSEDTPYEWYRNIGRKIDNTGYVKATVDFNDKVNMFADLQLRYINYDLTGMGDEFDSLEYKTSYLFVNPKLGVNYQITPDHRIYAVAGLVSREPTRSDIKDAIENGNDEMPKAEHMLDIEAGYALTKSKVSVQANLYAMLYKDQLTPSGDLSSSGYALMENVDKSYRLGIELSAGYTPIHWFSIDGNVTVSRNKILDYTFTDFEDGDMELQTYTKTTNLSFSPSVVGAAMMTFRPVKNAKLQIIGKYVGKQFCDNTSREVYSINPYFLLNFRASYTWQLPNEREIELQAMLNNLTNHKYRLNAWVADYPYYDDDDVFQGYYHDRAYLQQPGFNFMVRAIVRL